MKTPVLVSTFLIMTMTLTSFTNDVKEAQDARSASAEEQFALRVVTSFQLGSPSEYAALFPSLETFQKLMEDHAELYGDNLKAAKNDFAKQYNDRIIPAVYESFEDVIRAGKARNIDWNGVEFIRIELSEKPAGTIATVPFNIVFSSRGKYFRLQIERAMFLDGEWKTSQFVRLVE